MPNAAKPVRACGGLGFEHLTHRRAEGQVREAYDSSRNDRWPVSAAGTLGGNALHELGLADRAHLFGAGLPVHRLALDEHAADDVGPLARIL